MCLRGLVFFGKSYFYYPLKTDTEGHTLREKQREQCLHESWHILKLKQNGAIILSHNIKRTQQETIG